MKDKKGFVVSGVLYTILIVFLIVLIGNLNSLQGKKQILEQIKIETVDALDQPWKVEISELKTEIQQLRSQVTELKGETTPTGTVISVLGTKAPNGYLILEGQMLKILEYPALAQFFKEQLGKSNYYGGDGVATFMLPNFRGEFIRGYGNQGFGESAGIGIHQDATKMPRLWIFSSSSQQQSLVLEAPDNASRNDISNADIFIKTPQRSYTDVGYSNFLAGPNESAYAFTSRPTNRAVLFCIKY